MSKKRKSPDDRDLEESPPAGGSDQGRRPGAVVRCESVKVWTEQVCLSYSLSSKVRLIAQRTIMSSVWRHFL